MTRDCRRACPLGVTRSRSAWRIRPRDLDRAGHIVGPTARLFSLEVGPAKESPDPASVEMAHPSDAAWGTQVRLLGYEHPLEATVGQTAVVELAWLGLATWNADARLRLALQGAGGERAHEVIYPLSGYATSRWRVGEVIRELYDLELPAGLAGGTYTVSVDVLDGEGTSLGAPASLGTIEVSAVERTFELPRPPQVTLNARLGEGIVLLGYDVPQASAAPGGQVLVTLYWRCAAPVDESYTVFVHLLDPGGQVRGQQDRLPMGGRALTSGWVKGQVIVDAYEVPLDADAPTGAYRIEVGMYDARDMARLPAVDIAGVPLPDDRVLLDVEIEVSGP